jgi:IS1 family transposase
VSAEAIRRLRRSVGDHARDLHEEYLREVEATAVQMDERYGYVRSKSEPFWEASAIEPESRLLLGFAGGRRDQKLIEELMRSTKDRLENPADLVLMTDGAKSYETLFASIFGSAYRPARKGDRGRFPELRHRINRDLLPTCR